VSLEASHEVYSLKGPRLPQPRRQHLLALLRIHFETHVSLVGASSQHRGTAAPLILHVHCHRAHLLETATFGCFEEWFFRSKTAEWLASGAEAGTAGVAVATKENLHLKCDYSSELRPWRKTMPQQLLETDLLEMHWVQLLPLDGLGQNCFSAAQPPCWELRTRTGDWNLCLFLLQLHALSLRLWLSLLSLEIAWRLTILSPSLLLLLLPILFEVAWLRWLGQHCWPNRRQCYCWCCCCCWCCWCCYCCCC